MLLVAVIARRLLIFRPSPTRVSVSKRAVFVCLRMSSSRAWSIDVMNGSLGPSLAGTLEGDARGVCMQEGKLVMHPFTALGS